MLKFLRKKAMEQVEKDIEAGKLEKKRDEFFNLLFMISYSKGNKRAELIKKAKKKADKIPEFKGWPSNNKIFWDVESFGWNGRISKNVREFIKKELKKRAKGKCIELGSGSYPYLKKSVVLDFSQEMLDQIKGHKKVLHNLNEKLPFKDKSFDTVCMCFVVDYVDDLKAVLEEIKRVGKRIIIVQSKKPISDYYHKHEVKYWKGKELAKLLDGKMEEYKVDNHTLVFLTKSL